MEHVQHFGSEGALQTSRKVANSGKASALWGVNEKFKRVLQQLEGSEVFVHATRGAGVKGGLVPFVRRGKCRSKVFFTTLFTGEVMSSVISVRVPREVKEILEESGVDINREVRAFLEELTWKIRLKRHIEKWDRLLAGVKPSCEGFAVGSVREDRESH